jgi:ribonuclease HI
MAKKQKYYVVWSGSTTGIFTTWDECKHSIHGIKGAQYKSFKTLELAKQAYAENYEDHKGTSSAKSELTETQINSKGLPNLMSISVDAACSGNPGLMEYQGVETETKDVIFKMGPYKHSTNNIGEFLALVHAASHMKKIGDTRPIYTDSRTAMSWIRNKKVKTTLERNVTNEDSFKLVDRALIWLQNNQISNQIIKWETKVWGEIPADFGRK